MSSVDERIVKMTFDAADFTKKITSTISSITQLNKATDSMADNTKAISSMGKAFEQAEIMSTQAGFHVRDVWLKVASILEYQVAGKIVNIGKQIANAMTFEGINDGFKEYELKMGSVQTIMAGTGASLAEVNKYLEELNAYSDKTIYSFADMTNNIGKFTNAGVELEDAVLAIKGIANEAARSGANANEASRAMYNFSQALSAGYVKLIDWKSIENANMATKEFKDTLLEVASSMGTVEKGEDGMYKVLSKNANGATMKEAISATKNFNDSLAYQWMTTDVLTKTMKIYATDVRDMSLAEKKAFEDEMKALGFTEDQIKNFEQLGSAATDAASEVKTFSMLIDTLKEAIGSGWAQTWEILIGDFNEAKKLWTEVSNVLGGVIDAQSKARNDLLKGWDALGGRVQILKSIKNMFEAVVNIAKPVSEAMKEVFPPITVDNLLSISKGLKEFSIRMKEVSEDIAPKVASAAKGVFAIFHIGATFVKALVGAILPAGKGVAVLASNFLDAAAKAGEFIAKIDRVITKAKVFETIFAIIVTLLKKPINFIKENMGVVTSVLTTIGTAAKVAFNILGTGAKGILTILSALFSAFSSAAGPVTSFGDMMKNVFDSINEGLEKVNKKIEGIKPIFEGLKTIFAGIGTFIGTLFRQLGESISGISSGGTGIGGLMNIINALISGGILYKLYSGVKHFSEIGGILEGFGDVLDGFSKKIQADTLMNVAKAIAILAGSLFVIALVDSEKLAGATAAISTMMFSMAGAMSILMKAVNSFSSTEVESTFSFLGRDLFGSSGTKMIKMVATLGAVSKALISMGTAILMMSVGLKIVSSAAKDGHLWDSFAVVSLMLGELTAVAIVLSKFGGDKAVKGLTGMTTALVIMAAALKIVSNIVEGGNAWESLAILSIMLGELAGVALLVQNFAKYKMSGMTALISMAISLNLVVFALKSVSDALGNEGQHIWQALAVISIMLAELTAVTILMSKFGGFAALGGVGAIMAAAALLILVQALKQISDALGRTDQHIWQALGVIAASLVVLAVGLTAMAGTIPGAAGLLVASAALVVLGAALKIIGKMSLAEIGKGLLAMAGSLLVLAVGLTAMIVAIPGAIALVIAATGLTALAGALKLFGSMKLGEIVKALGAMTLALLGIALVGTILSVASPFLIAFSAALLVFGAAMIATGVGFTLFAAGMQSLIAVVPMGTAALAALVTTVLELIPVAIAALMDALGTLATKIVEYAPQFGQVVLTVLDTILTVIISAAPKIAQAVYTIMIAVMGVIAKNIPQVAEAGADIIIAFMEGISEQIPRIADEGYKCAIALIEGIANAIEGNNTDLINAVDHLMTAVLQAILQWIVKFTPIGWLIPEEMKDGILSGEFSVKDAIDDIIGKAVDGIKEKVGDFKKSAEELIGGFIDGLKGSWAGKAVSAAADFGGQIVDSFRSKKGLDEHSNSKKTTKAGEEFDGGFVDGVKNGKADVLDAASGLGGGATDALNSALAGGSDDVMATLEALLNNIKGAMNETEKATTVIKKNTVSAQKQAQMFDLVNDELENNMTAEEKATQETIKNTRAKEKNTNAQNASTTATGKGTKAAKKQTEVTEYANGVLETFVKNYGHLYKALGDDAPVKVATIAIKNLAEQTYLASIKAKKATDSLEETKVSIEDMIKSFTELKTKIYDSVKSMFEGDSFFQKFEVKTEKTMKDMLEAMHSNVNAVKDWSNKLVMLGNSGLDQGLLKQLAELGPKGFEYVNAFANATAEEIQEANGLFAEAAALPDSISNNVVASYAQAGLNVVAGFANGIDKNAWEAYNSADKLGLTTLSTLETALEENSPSRASDRDGRYLVFGLRNGIDATSFLAVRAASVMCIEIVSTIRKKLDGEIFYQIGQNIGASLAAGMLSAASLGAVQGAAAQLSEAASSIEAGISAESTAMSNSLMTAVGAVQAIAENDMTISPVISPVLDLTNVKNGANAIGGLFPSRSIGLASSIRIGTNDYKSDDSSSTSSNSGVIPTQITYTQNNYSPKALSRIEIYRDTRNQLSTLKGLVTANG